MTEEEEFARRVSARRYLPVLGIVALVAVGKVLLVAAPEVALWGAKRAFATPTGPDGGVRAPFAGLTPERVDELAPHEICFEACRANLECHASRSGDPSGLLGTMIEGCRATCAIGRAQTPPPAEVAAARACVRKLDCVAFDACLFGPLLGAPTASASASAPPVALAPAVAPPTKCPAGFVPVAGGGFELGSSDPAVASPRRAVEVAPFCIGKTEVTVEEYLRCASAGRCPRAERQAFHIPVERGDGRRPAEDRFCNAARAGRGKHPMNCVNARAAEQYCAWRGGQLPSEEEWEVAARGREQRRYPWGDEAPLAPFVNTPTQDAAAWLVEAQQAGFERSLAWPDTAPAGSHPTNASPFGALDMVGSLEEWTLGDPCAHTADANPRTRSICFPNDRVVRGGGEPAARRVTRNWQSRHPTLGFRCVHAGTK